MDNKNEPKIVMLGIDKLIPYANNSRTHSDAQVAQIAGAIREFGFTNPVLIDEDNSIIAGHGRILGARQLEMERVPCIRLRHLSEPQKKALIIADNKLAMNAGWDFELLALEIEDLTDAEYGIDILGFDEQELADIVGFGEEAQTGMPDLNAGDKEPFQQITFTLHDDQHEAVTAALMKARAMCPIDTGLNDNSNGNAIAFICDEWLRNYLTAAENDAGEAA